MLQSNRVYIIKNCYVYYYTGLFSLLVSLRVLEEPLKYLRDGNYKELVNEYLKGNYEVISYEYYKRHRGNFKSRKESS